MNINKNRARKASRGEAQIALRGSTLRFQAAACSRFIDGNGVGHRQLLSRNRRSSPAPGWCRAADPVGRALSRRRAFSGIGGVCCGGSLHRVSFRLLYTRFREKSSRSAKKFFSCGKSPQTRIPSCFFAMKASEIANFFQNSCENSLTIPL